MPNNSVFYPLFENCSDSNSCTFTPQFEKYIALYRGVIRVWIGDGETNGEAGCLYAKYVDNSIQEIGFVSDYEKAKAAGVTMTYDEWVNFLMTISDQLAEILQPATIEDINSLFDNN